ncbi:MAG: DNA polymerase III subunit beta [Ignavibacteria bacterium]|nr:DNA polymerase III subunit beta [Ignavibacteria bacterium]
MKFNIKGEQFVNSLTKLSSVIPTRSTLPILDNILFELEGNKLKLLASDLEIFVRTTVEVEGSEDGKVAIPAKRLLEISRTLTSADISVDVNEKNKLTLKTKNGKYSLSGEPPEDFPTPEEKENLNKIELDGSILRRFISKIIHAVNNDEIRRNMSGILFDIGKNELRFVATDGFRLGKIIKTNFTHDNPADHKIIVPLKTCQLILRLNNNEDSVVEYDENLIRIKFNDVDIYSKLIDDTFPNYETVIPLDNNKLLIIDKNNIENSLRRALIFADDITKRVKLEITNSSITIKADNPEIGAEGEETIDCEFRMKDSSDVNFDEEPFSIAFNASYLIDCVSHIQTDKINFDFNTPSKAAIATPTEQSPDEDFMELVMPVRVG